MPQSHVLLVDDDPALLDALSGTLQARFGHFTLDTCESGTQALELAKQRPYDTIIVDVNMPQMNGLQFLAEVKQVQPKTPVLMITAHANRTLMARALDGGAADFIPKPFEREDVVQAVRRGLELSRLQSVARKLEGRHRSTLERVGMVRQELEHAARHRFEQEPF
jgi:DNA-binding NtrC family response regulator